MKKIFLILTLIAFTITTNAQSKMRATKPTSAGGIVIGIDSVIVGGVTASYLYIKVQTNDRHGVLQWNALRKTASMNGTITLQASVDGINYFATSAADTNHVDNGATDVDKIVLVPATSVIYPYYRLQGVNAASTDTFSFRSYYFGRQN